jgi:hypothetical protein
MYLSMCSMLYDRSMRSFDRFDRSIVRSFERSFDRSSARSLHHPSHDVCSSDASSRSISISSASDEALPAGGTYVHTAFTTEHYKLIASFVLIVWVERRVLIVWAAGVGCCR